MSDNERQRTEGKVDERLLAFADRLRRGGQEEVDEEQPEVWVCFHMAQKLYALPVTHVREYSPVGKITRVPGAPAVVCGVASLRGHAIPVVDLKKVLGLSDAPPENSDFVLVSEQRGRLIGLLVDGIDRVVKLLPSRIKAAPPGGNGGSAGKILGFYELEDRSLILLSANSFLGRESGSSS
jgi:purine-binding chemotaxis protein CheW